MPLLPGKKNIGANITELKEHGSRPRSNKQILAIALRAAGEKPKGGHGGPRQPGHSNVRNAGGHAQKLRHE